MGTKRKAIQIQLAPEPRRSRRNVEKSDVIELINKAVKLNGDELKEVSSVKVAKQAVKNTNAVSTKTTKKAIDDEEIDFNKEFIPIRTYGKSNLSDKVAAPPTNSTPQSAAVAEVKVDEPKTRSNRLTGKINIPTQNKVDILKPAKTIKKKTVEVIQQKKKGNLTINSPPKIEIRATPAASNVRPSVPVTTVGNVSTIIDGGQKKVSFVAKFYPSIKFLKVLTSNKKEILN